jgi:hypothetical protein
MTKTFNSATATLALCLAAGGAFWAGCGDDDGKNGALFFGDVSTVTASVTRREEPRYAWNFLPGPSLAWAQSTCSPPSGGNLLFCVNDVCTIVQPSDCSFSQIVEIVDEPTPALLSFIDDANENAEPDQGELVSLVPHTLVFCNGDRVLVAAASVNFQTGASTASVTKDFDACASSGTPNPTGTPGGPTATPTTGGGGGTPTVGTPTAGTPTPTYAYSASLQEAPPTALAFLASLGVIGLLIPTRRRKH